MATTAERFNVGAAPATRLGRIAAATASDTTSRGALAGGKVRVRNRGVNPVDVGGAAVATGGGYQLDAGVVEDFELDPGEELWAVSAAAQVNRLDVIRFGEALA